MNYNEQLIQAVDFIKNNDDFLIVSHVHPDGDTISSSLAIALILKRLGKSYSLINENHIPDKFNFLPDINSISLISNNERKFSYIITVDVADFSRAGQINQLLNSEYHLLNIDHHPTNDNFGEVNLVSSSAAATVEVIYDLINKMKLSIDQDLATCIYTGLLTDTGGFRYSNTSSKVFRIAAELIEYDISPSKITQAALETISLDHINILKVALNSIEFDESGLISWIVLDLSEITREIDNEDTEGIINYARNITGVEVGILFKKLNANTIKVSLRSNNVIDVGAIAKSFGGGGHTRAAGYTYNGALEDAKLELFTKIKQTKGWNNLGK